RVRRVARAGASRLARPRSWPRAPLCTSQSCDKLWLPAPRNRRREPESIVLRFLLRRKAPDKDSKADKNQYWTCPQISRGDGAKFSQQFSFAVRSDHERSAAIAFLQGDGRV